MSDYEYLAHYGTKGMHWGDRRYQTKDGSLTPLGRIHYGIGEARKKASDTAKKTAESARKTVASAKNAAKAAPKKAGKALKNAPKATARAVKNTYNDLAKQRREHMSANRLRKQARLKEKIEERRQKLMVKESKKTLRELDAELTRQGLENLIKNRQLRVDKLNAKNDMLREAAMLKEQERALKRDMKTLKKQAIKDARKKYSKRAIANLSDAELSARITRLQNEIKLMGLEIERQSPTKTAAAKWIADIASKGLSESGTKLVGAVGLKAGRELLDLSDEDINEFIRLTKKK